jgi:pimeloyl-ACP methyl ester carboxylesterase
MWRRYRLRHGFIDGATMTAKKQKKRFWVGWLIAVPTLFLFGFVAVIWFTPPPSIIGQSPDFIETQYFDVEGVGKVAYWKVPATAPKRANYPMIYLAGGPGRGIDKFEALQFSRRYPDFDIYFLDQISVGKSERLPLRDITIDNNLKVINRFSETIVNQRAVVVGGSWGAALAARFALAYPQQVQALLLSAPADLPEVCERLASGSVGKCTATRPPNFAVSLEPSPIEREAAPDGTPAKVIEPSKPPVIPDGRFRFVVTRLHFANLLEFVNADLSQAVLPRVNRPMWEQDGMNTLVNTHLRAQHRSSQLVPNDAANKLPTLVLRGSFDFVPLEKIGGYQVLFPKSRFVQLNQETHVIEFDGCAPTVEARSFLAEYAGSSKLKSCKNRLVPLPDMLGGYTLGTDLTF